MQNIGKSFYNWFVGVASVKLVELDRLQKKAEFLLSENASSVSIEDRNTILFIKDRIKSISEKHVESRLQKVIRLIDQYTKASSLHVLAFDSFFYSIALLFCGVLVDNGSLRLHNVLLGLTVFIYTAILHAFMFEFINQERCWSKLLKPSYIFHAILIIFVISCTSYESFGFIYEFDNYNNLVLLFAFTSFAVFVSYIIICFILCFGVITWNIICFPFKTIKHLKKEKEEEIECFFKKYNLSDVSQQELKIYGGTDKV